MTQALAVCHIKKKKSEIRVCVYTKRHFQLFIKKKNKREECEDGSTSTCALLVSTTFFFFLGCTTCE